MTEDSTQEHSSGSEPEQGPGLNVTPAPNASAKPRRVPKTLLFNVPSAEAVEAYAAAAASAAEPSRAAAASTSLSEEAINTEKDLSIASQADATQEQEKKQQAAQKQSARRVAKTLLFGEVNLDAVKQAAEAASTASKPPARPSVTGEKKLRRIAKTLQESSLGSFGQEQLHLPQSKAELEFDTEPKTIAAPDAEPAAAVKPKRQQFVAKTMLDHSILWDTVSKFEAKMEERVAEQLLERANEPIKPFIAIVCKKQATPCAFIWDATETKERFRYCDLCKTPVYNFAGLEQPEADELIFQRENRRNATLYKRADGKYMTVNCPVEVKRKRDMIYMSVGGVFLAIAAIAIMVLMPRPPKPEPKAVVEDVQPLGHSGTANNRNTGTGSPTSSSASSGQTPPSGSDDGSFHMVNGQRVYPNSSGAGTAPVNFPPPVQEPAATTDADESGQFWQYDGPQPGTSDAPTPVMTQPQGAQPVQR